MCEFLPYSFRHTQRQRDRVRDTEREMKRVDTDTKYTHTNTHKISFKKLRPNCLFGQGYKKQGFHCLYLFGHVN